MKTSSLIKKANSRRTSLSKKIVYAVLVCMVMAVLFLVVPSVVRGTVAVIWWPFDQVRVWVAESGSSLPQYIRERQKLVAEINQLKTTLATEQGTSNTVRKLLVENDELRARAGAVPEARVLARVVGRPNQLPYDSLMLDRGSSDGVIENAPIFLGVDQIIGFISKVNEKTSLATMITTAGFSSSAYVYGPNIYTFAEGMGGGIMRVRVPQGILLTPGDLVVLPALDSGVYGEVTRVEASPTQPEQYGYVSTDIPLQSLYYVSIGKEAIVPQNYAASEQLVDSIQSKLFTVDLPPGVLVTPETHASSTGISTTTTGSSSAGVRTGTTTQ